jgi:carbonic anhydrase
MALRGTLAGLVTATGIEFADPRPVMAQSKLSPDAALQDLIEGNRRFSAHRVTAHEQDLAILKQNTMEKQEPFAAVLSCADSRVPVEMVFDQSIGHLFVTRVAGNVVTPEIIASLEYGAVALGTKVILVMGHGIAARLRRRFKQRKLQGRSARFFRIFSRR